MAGSLRKRVSWRSPTVSKVNPTAQSSTPAQVAQLASPCSNIATWTGSDTNHITSPWVR